MPISDAMRNSPTPTGVGGVTSGTTSIGQTPSASATVLWLISETFGAGASHSRLRRQDSDIPI